MFDVVLVAKAVAKRLRDSNPQALSNTPCGRTRRRGTRGRRCLTRWRRRWCRACATSSRRTSSTRRGRTRQLTLLLTHSTLWRTLLCRLHYRGTVLLLKCSHILAPPVAAVARGASRDLATATASTRRALPCRLLRKSRQPFATTARGGERVGRARATAARGSAHGAGLQPRQESEPTPKTSYSPTNH